MTRQQRLGMMLIVVVVSNVLLISLICGGGQGWRAANTMPSSIGSDHQTHKMRMIRTRHLQGQARDVPLFLSLYYLDDETATQLETKDPSNPLVAHLCQAINAQASGPQVREIASTFGATFQTFVSTLPSGTKDYDCEITDTNRVYDREAQDIFGPGYFILEMAVTQVVVVDSPGRLTDNQVWGIVETGFSRGAGGRVRFRFLLQEEPEFNTILNVEVLQGSLSPPQAAPTSLPTMEPTMASSQYPTVAPSTTFSTSPTSFPSSIPPSFSPTVTVSKSPTTLPTLTVAPSIGIPPPLSDATVFPTQATVPISADEDRQPLVFGAIAGGMATIMVSLFFIYCVWFPFCKNREGESTDEEPGLVESEESSSPSERVAAATMIPGVVNVSDSESASLADSTLGEHPPNLRTATKKPRIAQSSSAAEKEAPPVSGQDSFDESSLYTSTTEPERTQNMVISKLLPDSLNNTLDFEDDIIFPMSGSGSESEGEGIASKSTATPTTPRAKSSIDMSRSSIDMSESTRRISNVGGNFADGDEDSFLCSSPVESDEERAKEISRIIDRNTKGFDPFADDSSSGSSSFAFDKVDPVGSVFYEHPSGAHDDRSSPSNTTTSTKDVERLLLGSMRTAETYTAGDLIVQDHVSDSKSRSSDGSTNSKEARCSPANSKRASLSEDRKANNKLLRSVLEDARSLSDSRSPMAKSHASRQSAPSRFNKYQEVERPSRGQDLLADHLDFHSESSRRGRPKSSMSVGAPPLPRNPKVDEGDYVASLPRRSPRRRPSADGSARSRSSAASAPEHHLPYRTRYLEAIAKTKPQHLPPLPTSVAVARESKRVSESQSSDTDDDAFVTAAGGTAEPAPVSPSSSSTSAPPSPSGYLGAEPRSDDRMWTSEDSVMHMNSEDTSQPDTPASSPGVLGISGKNPNRILKDDSSTDSDGLTSPWLFDVIEQTLGPRSATADIESVSVRSSRSGRSSRRSRSRSRGRAQTCSSTRSRSRVSRDGSSSKQSIGNPSLTTNDSRDMALQPKNLEHDLKRLQLQIAGVLETEMDQVAGSNITVSTAGEGSQAQQTKRKNKKKRVVVIVPPGKLGIVLAKRRDGRGTVVAEVRPSSVMKGMVSPGDKILAVDEKDVTDMALNDITTLMESRSSSERRLTFISTFYSAD
eukprot:scaffold1690_cov182-Amphora_coffeaeformis.AAC.77